MGLLQAAFVQYKTAVGRIYWLAVGHICFLCIHCMLPLASSDFRTMLIFYQVLHKTVLGAALTLSSEIWPQLAAVICGELPYLFNVHLINHII